MAKPMIRRIAAIGLALLLGAPIAGLAQGSAVQSETASKTLFAYLNTKDRAWTMNHLCVLDEVMASGRYTNQNFADAILEFVKFRWDAASSQADKKFFYLGYISHTLTDLHWPGRIERNGAGQIVRFKTCAELGGPGGIKSAEDRAPTGTTPTGWQNAAVDLGANVLRLNKENRPFEEVAALLRNGVLMIQPGREAQPLGKALASSVSGAK